MAVYLVSTLVSLSISAILLTAAVPSVTQTIHRVYQRQAAHQLLSALETARFLALSHQTTVELSPLENSHEHTYGGGYEIKINNVSWKQFPGTKQGYWINNLPHNAVRFRADGRVAGTFGQFTYCLHSPTSSQLSVIINSMGRIRQTIESHPTELRC